MRKTLKRYVATHPTTNKKATFEYRTMKEAMFHNPGWIEWKELPIIRQVPKELSEINIDDKRSVSNGKIETLI